MGQALAPNEGGRAPGQLLGRSREQEMLNRLKDAALGGLGGALVLYGEPGVGKTALLDYAVETAEAFCVVRTSGTEGEMELPYAALQQLCSSRLELIAHLPSPQRKALSVALGLATGKTAPDPFLVGLAVLGLLSEAAEEQPLLCVIDDAQWLDRESARALGFISRRLLADKIALLFAAREVVGPLAGLPELHVGPLGHRDSRALLASVLPARLDESILRRIITETHGNPLALLELPRGLTPAQLAGGFGLLDAQPLSDRIEESFARRLAHLPLGARRLLLVAAADPVGDPALVLRAARILGIPEDAQRRAESEELLTFGTEVSFRHPLVRSAVYQSFSQVEQAEVHRALAEATDPDVDPDRRAWHRGQATSLPDEDVAADLGRSAARARSRGGFAAAAAFLERSAALTVDPMERTRRALVAADAKREVGALDSALSLADMAERGPLDEAQRAQLDVLRARVSFAADRGRDVPQLLLKAAARLEHIDIRQARDTYFDALVAAMFAGRLANTGGGAAEVAKAVLEAPRPEKVRGSDLLLDGLARTIPDGSAAGTPLLKEALATFRGESVDLEEQLSRLWLAGRAAGFIWDYDAWDVLTARQVQVIRDEGALTALPLTLSTRVGVHLFAGELAAAASLLGELESVADATESRAVPYGPIAVAVFRAHGDGPQQLIDASVKDLDVRGEGMALSMARWATAVLCNGTGRYAEAFAAAQDALENPNELWFSPWATVELIEAASRTSNHAAAAPALERLAQSTDASGTDWALAVQARSRAVLSPGKDAEDLYREAIDRLLPTVLRVDLARTHLLYGEWLRREQRRRDSREQLRRAYELFSAFGMEGFAGRAEAELRATGEKARKRTVETRDALTPQEERISQLAVQGASNKEIAAQLYLSPATVEYHLRKVYRKFGITGRTKLARHLLQSPFSLTDGRE